MGVEFVEFETLDEAKGFCKKLEEVVGDKLTCYKEGCTRDGYIVIVTGVKANAQPERQCDLEECLSSYTIKDMDYRDMVKDGYFANVSELHIWT